MKIVRTFLIFCAIAVTASNAGAFQISPQTSNKNCTDTEYRRQHPEKCPSFLYTAAPILSGATVLGGAIALIGLSGAAGGSDSATEYYQPTLAAPDYVGGDVSSLQLAAVTSAPEYEKNLTQYNDIRLAYSIARGYTGRGTIIAVLDAGLDSWHGAAVAAVAGGATRITKFDDKQPVEHIYRVNRCICQYRRLVIRHICSGHDNWWHNEFTPANGARGQRRHNI